MSSSIFLEYCNSTLQQKGGGHKQAKSSAKDTFRRTNDRQHKGNANWKLSQRHTSRLTDSIRKALGKVDDDAQSIKDGNNTVIDFRTFLIGLAHVAVWRTTDSKEDKTDTLLPLVIENFIKQKFCCMLSAVNPRSHV